MKPEQTNDSRYRAAELGALLARHYLDAAPHTIARVVFDMQAAAKKAKASALADCNNPDAGERLRLQRAVERAEQIINDTLATLGANVACGASETDPEGDATIELGGDPRGPCARLHIPGQRGDGWGEGFAIY